MDLLAILRKKIDLLENGSYKPGLFAVLRHVEAGYGHLLRGERSADEESAFTDTIYRTNQAFEGSIKEAYRVATGNDPSTKTPFEIEAHLEQNNVFRPRVLAQFKTYRKEWRNPSTHDYKLDFDSSEAFIALTTVSAFASVLLDQITERLAFLKSEREAQERHPEPPAAIEAISKDLLQISTSLVKGYVSNRPLAANGEPESESQLLGGLHGLISTLLPEVSVQVEHQLSRDKPFQADMMLSAGNERVLVEVKRKYHKNTYHNALAQVEHYMLISGVTGGILVFLPERAGAVSETVVPVAALNGQIIVLRGEA